MVPRTYRALLIANSTFPGDRHNLPDLEGPRNDPVLLREALCDSRYGLFPPDNVRLVQERTMSEVLLAIDDFFSSATRQDAVLLYYSGHGRLDLGNELFLCTHDTVSDRLLATAVSASHVNRIIDQSAAAATVILLDCCHAGAFKGSDLSSHLAGQGRFVVTSCRRGELANDTDVLNHASLFTHHVVQGLLGGAPDHDADGHVDLSELYHYVRLALIEAGRQRPERRFSGEEMAIARRPPPADDAPPQLDVSTTEIDLGEVPSDEELAPERIAVLNRGGGTLDWSVHTSAEWIELAVDDNVIVLHLHPRPGPNRANVDIRDHRTGVIKTVRVKVRVRPVSPPPPRPSGPPGVPAPGPPQEPHATAPWGARLGAAMIDGAILALLLVPGTTVIGAGPKKNEPCTDDPSRLCEVPTDVTAAIGVSVLAIGLIAWCVYKIVMEGGPRGQSLGKRATGIRVVDIRTGRPMERTKIAGRTVVALAMAFCTAGILLVIDLLFPLWDKQRQTLHDKVVGSVVVSDRPGEA